MVSSAALLKGYSTMFMGTKDAAFKDSGEVSGLGFRHESIVEESGNQYYVAFALSQRHEKTPTDKRHFQMRSSSPSMWTQPIMHEI